MKIGPITIQNGLFLAPMAGVTDRAFRATCRRFGAEYVVTEMVSAKALCYGDRRTKELMELDADEHPAAIQLFGSEPGILAEAAARCLEFGPDAIDLNMGCPTPKIVRNGDGSALMKQPDLIFQIVDAVAHAVPLPVTVKLRKGWDGEHANAVECALAAQSGGAAAVTVHGKTREQFYAPGVDLELIGRVKAALRIPVIGNGEITSPESALQMRQVTGCDGLMIGRGALGNPFLFERIATYLQTGELLPQPDTALRLDTALRQIERMVALKGEHLAMLEARKQFAWYIKGLHGAAKIKPRVFTMNSLEELRGLAQELLAQN